MSNEITQLSLDFNSSDDDPLPLLVAEKWGFRLRYVFKDETYWYMVRDWVAGLTNAVDPKRAWQSARKTAEMQPALKRVRNMTVPGTNAATPAQVTDDKGLYLIAANLRGLKNRNSLVEIKTFLSESGAFADLVRRNPEEAELMLQQRREKKYLDKGKNPEWIATRELGIITRKQLMGVVYDLLGSGNHLAIITNDTYRGVFGMTAGELRLHIGIPAKAVVRDHFSTMALVYTQAAEEACRIQLEKYNDDDVVAINDVRAVISTLSRLVGKQVKEMSKMLGIDIVTGRPLLADNSPTKQAIIDSINQANRYE